MGYTHYWKHDGDCPPIVWAQIARDVRKLLENLPLTPNGYPLALANGVAQPGSEPDVSSAHIWLNGAAPWDYETFLLRRCVSLNEGMFCKTARKPYDIVVCAVLLVAHSHAPKIYEVSSDGGYDQWAPAIRWYTMVLKRLPILPASIRPELAGV